MAVVLGGMEREEGEEESASRVTGREEYARATVAATNSELVTAVCVVVVVAVVMTEGEGELEDEHGESPMSGYGSHKMLMMQQKMEKFPIDAPHHVLCARFVCLRVSNSCKSKNPTQWFVLFFCMM